ncbi:hypothetical protein M405DRAFT_749292 [Rhizopogon salebrosus TDB-379]|nr:hypothetical protein M405DRAFT_749292 [Rhizopogon salebrosus TDB-379]
MGSTPSTKITRRQLALIPAYAFTDFKSQGQTIEHVLVDIGKTTYFGLSPFNAYVALSTTYSFVTHPKTYELKTNALTHLPKKAARTMQKENTVPNRK